MERIKFTLVFVALFSLIGCTNQQTPETDATKLYGSGNSIAYWNQLVNENN